MPPVLGGKASKSPFALLMFYLFRYKWWAIGALLAVLMSASIMLLLPVAVRAVLDKGFNAQSGAIGLYFCFLLGLAFLLAVASAMRYLCVSVLGEYVARDLRKDIFRHILTLPISFFDGISSGEIMSRFSADANQVKNTVSTVASIALRNLLMALGGFIMMFVTSYRLSLVELAALPIILIPILFLARKVRAKTRLAQDELAAATSLAAENIAEIKIVQSYAYEIWAYRKFAALLRAAFRASLSSVWLRALLTGLAIFLVFASVIATLYLGALDVLAQHLSTGALGQFVLYALLAASAFGQLAELGSQLVQALGALERLSELANEKSQDDSQGDSDFTVTMARGELRFQNVSFAYASRPKHWVLNNFSLEIKAGMRVAFVGATGAGKTTIFSLLMRFYKLQQGEILLDGININNLSLQDLRRNIAYVSQDNAIFNGTIYENILMGQPNATMLDIELAAKHANAYEFIAALPDGFNTIVGERGLMLSGGQKQRIALSRAFLKNAPILLLDEATSALDANSEAHIQQALEQLMQHKTTLIIAHRLATVLSADQIFVLEQGRIIEAGTHQELLANNGAYADLVKLQFKRPFLAPTD